MLTLEQHPGTTSSIYLLVGERCNHKPRLPCLLQTKARDVRESREQALAPWTQVVKHVVASGNDTRQTLSITEPRGSAPRCCTGATRTERSDAYANPVRHAV